MDNLIDIIGCNLANIRKERGLSLDQVANLTGVSKSMLSQIENGQKTPTVTVMWKIANGLKTSISTLMKTQESDVKIVKMNKSELIIEDDGKYRTGLLLPFNEDAKFEVVNMEIETGGVHISSPHGTGVKEYLFLSTGNLEIEIENNVYKLSPGEAIIFQGDIEHKYTNIGDDVVRAFSLFLYTN